ncbi:MAG TPA: FMN-binding protein [Vicinamibacteria bacterium]|nr:FMN-binding protein [Vicinamibacteria bacterium]
MTVPRYAYSLGAVELRFHFIWGGLALLATAPAPAIRGEVLMTEKAAVERAFPGSTAQRLTLYLTKDEVAAVEQAARSKLPSPIVTAFVARRDGAVTGRAVLDTHTVRTMPETVLTVVEPDGRLRMALVLQFAEPPDYLPREGWLRTLEGKPLDDELWPGRGVRRVTGATLTVQALTEAVRRSLAIEELVLKGKP